VVGRAKRARALAPAAAALAAARSIALAAATLALVAGPAEAAPDPIEERFTAASNLIADDRAAEAAAKLEALAREAPDHPLAPEALFSAAELCEERLADPARALALYQEIGRTYPDSRRALAASRRAAALSSQVGTGQEGLDAQRRFLEIRQGFAERPEAESFAMAEALLRDAPNWPGAPAVALWLAGIEARTGRYESALRRYTEAAARYREPEARFDALRGAGDVALHLGRYDEAARHYRAMDARGEPGRAAAIAEALEAVEKARGRSFWLWICAFAAAAGFLALGGSLALAARGPRAALRAMWPPPPEVIYLAPVGAVLSAVSFADYQGLGPAVTIVSIGGLAATWLSGAGLALRRALRGRSPVAVILAHAVIAAIAVLAIVYVAVQVNNLLDPVLDTFRYGPER
jgi:tetratricopeptide (TPR) repeat protein